MKPFSVSTPRKRKDKTFWLNIGAAWPRDDGGFKVELDALPIADAEGKVMLLISPPREDDRRAPASPRGNAMPDDLDGDAIPFAPEWRA